MRNSLRRITAWIMAFFMIFQTVPVQADGNFIISNDIYLTDVTLIPPLEIESPEGTILQVGGELQLSHTENYEVTWSSSDPDIATVDENGKVTGVSTGKVTITAEDASDGDQRDSLKLEVVKVDQEGTMTVYISGQKKTLVYNGEEQTISGFTAQSSNGNFDRSKVQVVEGKKTTVSRKGCGTEILKFSPADFTYADNSVKVTFEIVDNAVLKITPAPLTVSAGEYEISEGAGLPEFTPSVQGLLGEDTIDLSQFTISKEEGESAGEYTLTVTGPSTVDNYSVGYINGKLTILPFTVRANRGLFFSIDTFGDSVLVGTGDNTEIVEYTVTFLNRDGETILTSTVVAGEQIGQLPAAPEVDGYHFVAWNDQDGREISEQTEVQTELTIHPVYEASYFTGVADTDATDPLFNLTELYVYDNGRNQWASKGWYRLKKQEEGILTNKPLEKWVEGLGIEKERPSDRDKPDTLEKDKDYSFIAEYDFAGFTFKYDGKTYSYYDENSGAVPPTGNYYTVSNKVRVVAAHQKIGGMVNNKPRWLNEATDYFADNNAIDCFKRNFKIYLHDVSGQTLYNFLNVDRNNKYYRLKTGEIITKDIKEFKVNEDIPSSMYTLNPEGEYNFSNVALKLDGITYVYSQTPLTGELDAWYSIDYSKTRVRRLDRIHEDPTWFKEESGWLDVRKEEYPTDTNEVIAFHRDYFATLHDPQYIGVKLVANNGTYTYDGELKTVSGYEVYQGEKKLTDVTFSGVTAIAQETDAGDYTVDFTGYVLNETKADNGKKYIITEVVPGKLTINPAAVTVTAKSEEFTYDGNAHSNDGYDVTGLVGGDEISAVVTGSITFPSESPVTNKLESYEFTTGTPGNYTVTTADGELTMKAASVAITITAASQEWTYDGAAHSNNAVTVTSGALLAGDTLVASATGSVTNVADTAEGNNPIAEGYKIMHGEEDVTANYAITAVAGKLTINPAAVTVTAKSEEFTYDGTAHSNAGYDVDGLVGDDAISAVVTGSITFPSESPVTN